MSAVPAVRFVPPEGFDKLPKKERVALRRAWKEAPTTIAARRSARAARAENRAEKAAAFKRGFDRFVFSPVLHLIAPSIRAELAKLDEPLDDEDKDDVIDEVFEKLKAAADDAAAFENLKAIPLFGAIAAEGAEKFTDQLIEHGADYLEEEIRDALEAILAELDAAAADR